jgi:hypothetical protein
VSVLLHLYPLFILASDSEVWLILTINILLLHKMTKKDQFNQFLPAKKSEKLSYDTPIEQQPVVPLDRIPSGYDPMGQIQLEGRAFSSLKGGKIPWWVLISSWIFIGIPSVVGIYLVCSSKPLSWRVIPALLIISIPLIILCRGTNAKFSSWRRSRK